MPLNVTKRAGDIRDASQRPDLIGNPDPGGSVCDKLAAYFYESAFERRGTDMLGAAPRTLGYPGPGATNVDFIVSKSFTVAEGQRVQFRFELQNATNKSTLGAPNTTFGSGGFGRINGYQRGRGARIVQIGLKHVFELIPVGGGRFPVLRRTRSSRAAAATARSG